MLLRKQNSGTLNADRSSEDGLDLEMLTPGLLFAGRRPKAKWEPPGGARGYPAPTRKTPTVHCLAYRRRKPFALYTADPLDGRTTAYLVASSEAGGSNDPPSRLSRG